MSVIVRSERRLSELDRDGGLLTARSLVPIALRRALPILREGRLHVRLRRIEQQRRLDGEAVRSLVLLGGDALRAQLALSLVEAEVVERSPHANHGVAMIKEGDIGPR